MVEMRIQYPFYGSIDTLAEFKILDTLVLDTLITHYRYGLNFLLIEDFEGVGIKLTPGDFNKANLVITHDSVYEGQGSGRVVFSSQPSDTIFLYESANAYPTNTVTTTFLELNYWNDVFLTVGVVIRTGSDKRPMPVITLKPATRWKKIYIELTDYLTGLPRDASYSIYFAAIRQSQSNFILLDNIKLIKG